MNKTVESDVNCNLVKGVLVALGADALRESNDDDALAMVTGGLAAVIMVLEHNPSTIGLEQAIERTFQGGKNHMKAVDIALGCERSVTQFFRKRISCSCLDKRYAAVKSKPKSGLCDNCKQRKERTSLYVCSMQKCTVLLSEMSGSGVVEP